MKLSEISNSKQYEQSIETCTGCANQCKVRLLRFDNGKQYANGNNCEKIYSSTAEGKKRGVNLFQEKYKLLFAKHSINSSNKRKDIKICIPRALGIYENYPFWQTLFAECGIETILSGTSTARTYEKGIRSIMADNICFPAKLMHGHVMDLVEKIDKLRHSYCEDNTQYRLFYPFVVYEQKEDTNSKGSFNCPIVSAYSDVIKSSIDTVKEYDIEFDSPVVSFNSEKMLRQSCEHYLCKQLGVNKAVAREAIGKAIAAQEYYLAQLERRSLEILEAATRENRMVIMLAGRPYHTDPLIEHKISEAIADMGVDVITEHAGRRAGAGVYKELNAVTQWAYPNRIFKAAYFVGQHKAGNLEMVELTSFGCGPDAFILDEVQHILNRHHKNLTILKIDDVNNIGSLKLRVRSLIESSDTQKPNTAEPEKFVTTRTFEEEDKQFTILAPYFAEGYSELLPALFSLAGYRLVVLPTGNQEAAETGLRYANNDVCYPATIVIGSIMNALSSGKYDLRRTAVIMTQTGGQCRATNYYSLIKNAMVRAGYDYVPLLSLATGEGVKNSQPGFQIDWKRLATPLLNAMAFADSLNRLYHSAAVREKGNAIELLDTEKQKYCKDYHSAAKGLRFYYLDRASELIEQSQAKELQTLMREAVADHAKISKDTNEVPIIGLVGEIYVKYNSFSHKNVVNWLIEQKVEVIPPSIIEFFSTSFVSRHANRELNIKEETIPQWITDTLYRYIRRIVKKYDRICSAYPYYHPMSNIFEIADLSKQVISTAADFGEGWFLPGEICHLAEIGVKNVISLQPFGCIANHIISKGIEKKIRTIYPQLNLLFLDFDSSTSDANIYNRLHFLLDNARKDITQSITSK